MLGELILVSGFLFFGIGCCFLCKHCNNNRRCGNNFGYPSSCTANEYYRDYHNENNINTNDIITTDIMTNDNKVIYNDTPPPSYYE
jgi:hypothetical protein